MARTTQEMARVPRRGEIWRDSEEFLFLVVSADPFNLSKMGDVICLQVRTGDLTIDDPSPYAIVIRAAGSDRTIYADDLQVIVKRSLVSPVWEAPGPLIWNIDDSLREILTPGNTPHVMPGRGRVRLEPNAVLFADLWIGDTEESKPIVIISSAEYGQLVANRFVIACRVTSNVAKVRETDVVVGVGSKVVCSHVCAVPVGKITLRHPSDISHVPDPLAASIRAKVFEILGI